MTADLDITAEISTLEGLLGRARSDIANGGVIDLTPMVERINGLCSQIDRLPREDGQAYRPALVTLLPTGASAAAADWFLLAVPGTWESTSGGKFAGYDGFAWYRCYVKIPATWPADAVILVVGHVDNAHEAYVNGEMVGGTGSLPPAYRSGYIEPKHYAVPTGVLRPGRYNLIAVRIYDAGGSGGMRARSTGSMRRCFPVICLSRRPLREAGNVPSTAPPGWWGWCGLASGRRWCRGR